MALLLAIAAGCGGPIASSPVASALAEVLAASPRPATIDLGEITDFAWDQVFVFGPYTPEATIDETLGFQWRSRESDEIQRNDYANLLVFLSAGKVVNATLVPRGQPEFSTLNGPIRLDRADAVFRFGLNGAAGWSPVGQ